MKRNDDIGFAAFLASYIGISLFLSEVAAHDPAIQHRLRRIFTFFVTIAVSIRTFRVCERNGTIR